MRLVFALLLVCVYQVESAPAYQASPSNEESSQSKAAASEQAPSSPAVTPVAATNQKQADDEIKRSEWIQIFISGIVALVVLWQGWLYYDQRRATRIAERGYIGVKSADLLGFEPGQVPTVQMVLVNGGRTPVWNVYTPGTFVLRDTPPDEEKAPPPPKDETGAFIVAGGTGKVQWVLPRALNLPTINEIIAGRLHLYLKGEAWFEDCWGDKRFHQFYLIFEPKSGAFVQRKRYAEYMDYQMSKGGPIERRRV